MQKTRDKEIKKETQKEKQKSDPSKIFNKIQIGLGVFNDLLSNINKTRAESPTNEASLTHANS